AHRRGRYRFFPQGQDSRLRQVPCQPELPRRWGTFRSRCRARRWVHLPCGRMECPDVAPRCYTRALFRPAWRFFLRASFVKEGRQYETWVLLKDEEGGQVHKYAGIQVGTCLLMYKFAGLLVYKLANVINSMPPDSIACF